MSCDVTKLEYLAETKEMFRKALDPKGKVIKDDTPFRDYVTLLKDAVGIMCTATLTADAMEMCTMANAVQEVE